MKSKASQRKEWAFDCSNDEIRGKMESSELYPDKETEIVGERNLHKMKFAQITRYQDSRDAKGPANRDH